MDGRGGGPLELTAYARSASGRIGAVLDGYRSSPQHVVGVGVRRFGGDTTINFTWTAHRAQPLDAAGDDARAVARIAVLERRAVAGEALAARAGRPRPFGSGTGRRSSRASRAR